MDRISGRSLLTLPFVLALVLLAFIAVLFDNGVLLAPYLGEASYAANYLHELFHDGRHLLGGPRHMKISRDLNPPPPGTPGRSLRRAPRRALRFRARGAGPGPGGRARRTHTRRGARRRRGL